MPWILACGDDNRQQTTDIRPQFLGRFAPQFALLGKDFRGEIDQNSRKEDMKRKSFAVAYLVWILLGILALIVANQIYVTMIFLTTEAIATERFYTFGWNIYTVSGFARFFIFLLGMAWLFWLGITEHYLVQAPASPVFWRRAGRLVTLLIVFFIAAYLLLLLFG